MPVNMHVASMIICLRQKECYRGSEKWWREAAEPRHLSIWIVKHGTFSFHSPEGGTIRWLCTPDIEIHSGHSTEGQQSLVQSRLNGQFLKINKQQHILHSIQHVQPLSFLHCWSDGVQLSASYVTIRRILHIGLLQTVLNSSLRQSCSLEVSLNDMHYINSRFTYILNTTENLLCFCIPIRQWQ